MEGRRKAASRLFPALGALLALTLSACGSSSGTADSTPAASSGATSNSTASSAGSASAPGSAPASKSKSIADLLPEAKKEGSLTWYTTFSDKDVQPMVQAFNKKYPGIKVNALRLSADKIPARVLTEQKAGKYNADVISGNSSYVGQLIDAGALEAYDPPDAAPLPEGTDLPDGFQSYTYVTTTAIAYNPTVLKQKGLPVPQTWEDLTKPAWKGQFSVNPGAVNWYDAMIVQMGHDKALALAKALGDNSPRLVSSHTQAVTQVQAGEPVATLMAYGYKAASLKKKTPDQLDFVNTVPLPTGVDMIDIAKNPPHPAAAKLFLDWIVSQDGQQTIVTLTNHTSLRSDVSNDKTVWDPSQWKPVWSRAHLPGDTFNQEAQELKAAFHAP